MNLRELLEKHAKFGYVTASALVLIALGAVFTQVRGSHGNPPGVSTEAYYTTEDQLTGAAAVDALFVDSVNRVPPFDHDGKPAYAAKVFCCNGGRIKWVNTLYRYSSGARANVQKAVDDAVLRGATFKVDTSGFDAEIQAKPPGPGPWLGSGDRRFADACAANVPPEGRVDDLTICVP